MDQAIIGMKSEQMLKYLLDKHYSDAFAAKAAGKPVVWSSSVCPQDLLDTFDLTTCFPENHSAAVAARKMSDPFIEASAGAGYSVDICSYARINLAYLNHPECAAQDMPLPDLIICNTNICHTVIKWYENIAKQLKIPFICIESPFDYDGMTVADRNIDYFTEQLRDTIRQLEEFTGKNFDPVKFKEVGIRSNETIKWWIKGAQMCMATPSPIPGFKLFNYMSAAVTGRAKEESAYMFRTWYEELKERIAKGLGPWKDQEEKYRVLWEGIACWPHLNYTYQIMKKYGVNMITSTYPTGWQMRYEPGSLEGLARAYTAGMANRSLEFNVNTLKNLIRDYNAEGIIYHSNRSCKLMTLRGYETQRVIEAETGVPCVFFDGDQSDPSAFSEAQFETRIQALVEIMDARKAERSLKHDE